MEANLTQVNATDAMKEKTRYEQRAETCRLQDEVSDLELLLEETVGHVVLLLVWIHNMLFLVNTSNMSDLQTCR
jgi:hypothetical protein